MKPLDYILLGAIAVIVAIALCRCIVNYKNGKGIGGCCGDCSSCKGCGSKK